MKKDWTYKKLGEVTTKICDGSHNPPHGVEYSKFPMLSSKNIFFDRYDYESPRYLSKEDFEIEDKRTNVSDGDVLLTIVGTVGRTCCVMAPYTPFTLQRSVAVLKPKKEMMLSRFLMYSLHSLSALWETEAKGVAQKGVYLKQVANIQIPIPSLDEQQQIVAELDLLSGMIEKQKAQIEELDKLSHSIFYDMFGDPVTNEKGWELKKLEDCCKNLDSKRKPITAKDREPGNIPYYGASGVVDHVKDYIFDGDYLLVSEDGANLIFRHTPIAFSISGKTWVNNHAHILKFETSYEQTYFEYSINLRDISEYVTGCAQPKFTQANLNALLVAYPPLSLQQEFAAKIEAIEAMKAKVRQSLKESETLFNSRMDYYFN